MRGRGFGAASVVATGAGAIAGVVGGTSSAPSPTSFAVGAGGGGGAKTVRAVAVAGAAFGSSVETAMTAAAVSATTIAAATKSPTRAPTLGFFSPRVMSIAARLRVGPRPLPMSFAVYTWNVTGAPGASSGGLMIEGDEN